MDIIQEMIVELNISKEEPIQMCTGSIFDLARLYLKEHGFKVEDVKIEGKLQYLVEQAYLSHIESLGVDINKISLEAGRERFFSLFYWVSDEYPTRKQFVKSGMKGWIDKWDKVAKQLYEKKTQKRQGFNRRKQFNRGGNRPYGKKSSRPFNKQGNYSQRKYTKQDEHSSDGPSQPNHHSKPGQFRTSQKPGPQRRSSDRHFNQNREERDGNNRDKPTRENADGETRSGKPFNKRKYSSVSNDPKNKFY